MRLTQKQKQEIDFLTIVFREAMYGDKNYNPNEQQIKDFVDYTAKGKGEKVGIRDETNPLKIAKRNFDISVKLWQEDMKDGLIYYMEILEDYNDHPYIVRVVNSIRNQLKTKPCYDGVLGLAAIGYLNSKHCI